jgi:hypothetical protein
MSARPAVLEAVLAPFCDAGLRVSVKNGYIRLHDVAVVDQVGAVRRGTLIAQLAHTDHHVTPPATHQAWFEGPYPCFADGSPMEQLRHSDVPGGELAPGIPANFFFSNKEKGWTGYATHFEQLHHYWRLITDQARVVDPGCTPQLGRHEPDVDPCTGVFRYIDANSLRGRFMHLSAKFSGLRIAIVGLGGTGGYILDHVAKTPVAEIHLFDGDVFDIHNAFRAPGAAESEDFGGMKVDYFHDMYDAMRIGIVPHRVYIDEATKGQLNGFDFVFVCVDKGPARGLIGAHLMEQGVPFIDCGLDVSASQTEQLSGVCRATVVTAEKNDHFFERAPTMAEDPNALYAANIQISDLNAMNALMAVIRWKQYVQFYADPKSYHQFEFTSDLMAMTKSEAPRDEG